MSIRTLVLMGGAALVSLSSYANAQTNNLELYSSISEIPYELAAKLSSSKNRERYISQLVSVLRRNAGSTTSLTLEEISNLETKLELNSRRAQMRSIIVFDDNFDGKVSYEEVVNNHEVTSSNTIRIKQKIDNVMSLDLDNDGFINVEEMLILKKNPSFKRPSKSLPELRSLLKLDPNKDGKLTVIELTRLAEKSFDTADINQDGTLSTEEITALKEGMTQQSQAIQLPSSVCKLPKLGEGHKFIFVGMNKGNAVSTVSVAGQVNQTTAVHLQIDKGTEKLYLIAVTSTPLIWNMTGDTGRIEQLVLLGPSVPDWPAQDAFGTFSAQEHDKGGKSINVGVVGVSKGKVQFRRARDCKMDFSLDDSTAKKKMIDDVLLGYLERAPDLFYAVDSTTGLRVSKDSVSADISEELDEVQETAPTGFHQDFWDRHIRYMSGGLVELKAEDVISDGEPLAYSVLPSWAGMAKLASEGAVVPYDKGPRTIVVNRLGQPPVTIENVKNIIVDDALEPDTNFDGAEAYKIVKDIPYYPSGMYGEFATRLVIGKGVKLPKGYSGHSNVILEEIGVDNASPFVHIRPYNDSK